MTTEVITPIEINSIPMKISAPTNSDPMVPDLVDPMVRQLHSITELIETLSKTSKSLTAEMKILTKDVNKLRVSKMSGKKVKRVVDPDVPRKPGALEKPVPITDELADFLELTRGDLYSRQSITQRINKFVKDNDLQNPENRRYILLESDAGKKLKILLRDPDQPLTFFNIQRYLKDHYPKVEILATELSKVKSVDVTEQVTPHVTEQTMPPVTEQVTPHVTEQTMPHVTEHVMPSSSDVVPDASTVDESEPPTQDTQKKKIIRKVVKKPTTV